MTDHQKVVFIDGVGAGRRSVESCRDGVRFLTVGKYTICYRADRRDVIELSTTIKHPNDRFDKHTGQFTALQRFAANNRIHLKSAQGLPPKQFLQLAFSVI